MKTFDKSYSYDYPWSIVASFFWKRYPSPYSKHVISEDILERRVLEDGRLYTKRLLHKMMTTKIPMFIQRHIGGLKNEHILEESIVDPSYQSIETITWNVGSLARYMVLFERCNFIADRSKFALMPSANHKTTVVKQAWTTTNWKSRWTSILNRYLIYNYKSKADTANKGFLFVINKGLYPTQTTKSIIQAKLLQSASEVRETATDKVSKQWKI